MTHLLEEIHTPVLLQRCVDLLLPALSTSHPVLIDATVGMGGHSAAILKQHPSVTVVGIDRDPQALKLAQKNLETFGDRFKPVHTTFDRIDEVAAEYGSAGCVDAILFDLGVSSLQIDSRERGFSYSSEAPLDMRMDTTLDYSAADLLSTASQEELTEIIRTWGEERYARRIAERIVKYRQEEPLQNTAQLADLVRGAIPAAARRRGGNPAKRTFQAIRIAVNQELEILNRCLPRALRSIGSGGRIVVESYHSLEDRLVKQVFKQAITPRVPHGLPVPESALSTGYRLITRGAETADEAEVSANPRSASVRLRAIERLPINQKGRS